MAEWKTQVPYNCSPSYHSYAYSLVYQSVPEQNQENLPVWGENGAPDYSDGAPQNICDAVAPMATLDGKKTSPCSPETLTESCFQDTGVVYLGGTQENHLEACGDGGGEVKHTRRASISDSGVHTSPDSWSSLSSRESSVPQVNPTASVKKEAEEEPVIRNLDGNEDVSSSLPEDSCNLATPGNGDNNSSNPAPLPSPKKPSTNIVAIPKTKVRSAFSESQMNALVQRFSVQRYLTPAEMKNLAEMTGLTYKQVKTWFQNRRMKLRRHQKDASWVSERFAIPKDPSSHRPVLSDMASHIPPYQGDGQPQFMEHYSQHPMEAAFKTPPNLAYYLSAVGGSGGPAGYPPWPTNAPQATVADPPHNARWSVPQGAAGPIDYNPNMFSTNTYMQAAHFENKEGEPVNDPLNTPVDHSGNQ